MKQYTFYWKDGKKEVYRGDDKEEALNLSRYVYGELRTLDFHCNGNNNEYKWDKTERKWKHI